MNVLVILLTFRAIFFICLEKFKSLFMVRPKYLNSLTHSIISPPKDKSSSSGVARDENTINLLFAEFGTSLFMFRYVVRSEKSLSIFWYRPSRVVAVITNAASSANKTVTSSTASGISFIKRLKHSGPSIDP